MFCGAFALNLLRSLLAACILLGIAYGLSNDRAAIRLRVVSAALACQVGLGGFVFLSHPGQVLLATVAGSLTTVLGYGKSGVSFLFGGLVGPRMPGLFGDGSYIFAFQVLPMVVFVSALISVLYHVGIMQQLVRALGFVFEKIIGVSRVESFCAVTTVILGSSEMPVAVRPFFAKLPTHAIFAMMASSMASVSGSALAGYAGLGVRVDYLLAASVMAMPGGLLFGKLIYPSPRDKATSEEIDLWQGLHRQVNLVDAIATGATVGLRIAATVGAMLVAFIGLIALANGALGAAGHLLGFEGVTLQGTLGQLLRPLAYLLGVQWDHAALAGDLIGQKIVLNEFVAYASLSPYLGHPAALVAGARDGLDPKSIMILSFALCGFSNISSVAVLVGSFGSIDNARRADVARLGVRAVIAGGLSNLMSADIAGMFYTLQT